MKHAFIITAFKDAPGLLCLVRQLSEHDSFFYIGVDKKSELAKDPLLKEIQAVDNVYILSKKKIHWGGFSHLRVLISLLAKAFDNPEIARFHSLSGQCFPVTTLKSMSLFFEENPDKEYISHMELPSSSWEGGGLDRLKYFHLNDILDPKRMLYRRINPIFLMLQKNLGVNRRLLGYFPKFYGGGTWWSLGRNAVNRIFQVLEKDKKLLNLYKNTHCSEEIFIQTILMNSNLKKNIVNDDLRYIDWEYRNGNCPAVLDDSDYSKIKESKKLFARKFDSIISESLKKKIQQDLAR